MRDLPTGSDRYLRLRRESRTSARVSLLWRITLAFALIGIALAVHWLDRDGLRDNVDGSISFSDVLYFTVTTVGYGDIVPVTQQVRMFVPSSCPPFACSCGSFFWEQPMTFFSSASGRNGACA